MLRRLLLATTLIASPAGATILPGLSAGPTITSATVNGSNHLVIGLSNGASLDAGALPSGSGAAYQGDGVSANNLPEFPVLGAGNGVAYFEGCPSLLAMLGLTSVGSCGTIPIPATAFTLALGSSSVVQNAGDTLTVTPGGAWPNGEVLTPSVSGVAGSFSPSTITPTGSAPAVFTFTGNAVGSGTLNVSPSVALTNTTGALAVSVTTPPQVTATIATPSGGTATAALTVTGTASNASTVYVSLSTGGNEQGSRVAATVTGGAYSAQVTPTAAGSYTASVYAAATGGAALYTSGSFTVAASTVTNVSFAGAAGAPTGNQVLTPQGSSALTGLALNGNGGLVMPSDNNDAGLFEAIGKRGDGTFTINVASGSSSDLIIFLRASSAASSANYYEFYCQATNGGQCSFNSVVGGTVTQVGSGFTWTNASTITITTAGSSIQIAENGTTRASFTDSTVSGPGYVGLGHSSSANVPVVTSISAP